jgi:hypothetical protein
MRTPVLTALTLVLSLAAAAAGDGPPTGADEDNGRAQTIAGDARSPGDAPPVVATEGSPGEPGDTDGRTHKAADDGWSPGDWLPLVTGSLRLEALATGTAS